MEFLIISGMSGAGKSRVANILEDLDFYCVDNMPVMLMPKFAELCLATMGRYERVALVTDIRGGNTFDELFAALDEMRTMGCDYKILFIEASVEAIIKRYKESRRRHPLEEECGNVEKAVRQERQMLASVRSRADYIIDTSGLTLGKLQRELYRLFAGDTSERAMKINVMSFGFKYGVPIETDLVFDVRFLPNPFYVPELRELCGRDKPVKDYIFGAEQTEEFMGYLTDFVGYLVPQYIEEGKPTLVICLGCTGGQHRSVAVAEALADFLAKKGYRVECSHRDVEKSQ